MVHTKNGERTGAFGGDAIEFTGRIEFAHGALFHEFVFIEGIHVGETGSTPRHIVTVGTVGIVEDKQ